MVAMPRPGVRTKVYKNRLGEWHWVTYAGNNRTIASSLHGFSNKQDCIANALLNGVKKKDLRE
jgi:uncharacterized protein YegP (UPF0339 family)